MWIEIFLDKLINRHFLNNRGPWSLRLIFLNFFILISNQKTLYIHAFYRLMCALDCQWARRGSSDNSLVYSVFKKMFCFHCLCKRHQYLMHKVNGFWEVGSCSVSHNFLLFLWIEISIRVFKRTGHCSVSWARWIQADPSNPIYLFKYDVILSSELRLKFPVIKVLY